MRKDQVRCAVFGHVGVRSGGGSRHAGGGGGHERADAQAVGNHAVVGQAARHRRGSQGVVLRWRARGSGVRPPPLAVMPVVAGGCSRVGLLAGGAGGCGRQARQADLPADGHQAGQGEAARQRGQGAQDAGAGAAQHAGGLQGVGWKRTG